MEKATLPFLLEHSLRNAPFLVTQSSLWTSEKIGAGVTCPWPFPPQKT